MEHKKGKPKLSSKRRESTDLKDVSEITSQLSASTRPTSTPIRNNTPLEDEDSPYFPCSTQEMNEDVDVLWDWNSPQSKSKSTIPKKSKKRLILQHSPKVPFRRHPSNNNEQIKQDFSKLREEFRALKAEIAKPDNEESLVLSPREEEVFKKEENESHLRHIDEFDDNMVEEEHPPEVYQDDFDDPFDDDMDEQLIIFSQRIESEIHKPHSEVGVKKLNIVDSRKDTTRFSNNGQHSSNISTKVVPKLNNYQPWNKSEVKLPLNTGEKRPSSATTEHIYQKVDKPNHPAALQQTTNKKPFLSSIASLTNVQMNSFQDSEVFNDSFDNVLSQMKDEDLDQLTQVVDIKQCKNDKACNIDKKSKVFPRSQSEEYIVKEPVQMTKGKVEWHRTQSFESYNAQLSREKLQEIEKKRLEAKAKRDSKKKYEVVVPTIIEVPDSPMKYSPDEIERKRLQALEKLEAKRLNDIIEKKKQEALKRREEKRKKNAATVKSSLTTRL